MPKNETYWKLFWNFKAVYDGNWTTNTREQLIPKIKKCITDMDMDVMIKMFDRLEGKIQQAHDYGLDTLIQPKIDYWNQKPQF